MEAPSVPQNLATLLCLWVGLIVPVEAMGVLKRMPLEWPCRGKQKNYMMVSFFLLRIKEPDGRQVLQSSYSRELNTEATRIFKLFIC